MPQLAKISATGSLPSHGTPPCNLSATCIQVGSPRVREKGLPSSWSEFGHSYATRRLQSNKHITSYGHGPATGGKRIRPQDMDRLAFTGIQDGRRTLDNPEIHTNLLCWTTTISNGGFACFEQIRNCRAYWWQLHCTAPRECPDGTVTHNS